MSKPEHQQPALGRNPNRIETWDNPKFNPTRPTSSRVDPKQTDSRQTGTRQPDPRQTDPRQTGTRPIASRQTGVWHSPGEQDALKTGVWNPARQSEAPAGNRWVLLGIVVVCSLSSFVVFQSLLRPTVSPRSVSARQNAAPRALPPAVDTQAGSAQSTQSSSAQPSEAEQVAASAVTFGEQASTGVTKPVGSTGSESVSLESTGSSTIVETTPTATLPASQIRLEQVDSIGSAGGQPVLHFKDGSSLNVDPFTLGQLPSDVRLRLTYSRGRDGP
jgi:hypothetical protein